MSAKVTLHLTKWVSSELSFTSNRTKLRIAGIPWLHEAPQTMSALLRQFSYNLLVQAGPNGARFRPYLAVGSAFQLILAVDAHPMTNRLLKFTLADLGIITAAHQFGSKPPLEGGGIFQVGLQYDAGLKYQVHRRYFFRVDFREILSSQPDLWSDSYKDLSDKGPVNAAACPAGRVTLSRYASRQSPYDRKGRFLLGVIRCLCSTRLSASVSRIASGGES